MTRPGLFVSLTCVLALSFVACDDGGEQSPTAGAPSLEETPTPSEEPMPDPTPTEVAECPDQTQSIPDDDAAVGGSLADDFDGDGERDDARIFVFENAEPGCKALLVVDGDDSVYSIPVWRFGADAGLEIPGLYAMVEINGAPGPEILVNEAQGASSQFIGAYTIVEGELRMITLPGGGDFGGLFAYGGSVGHLEAVDCVDPGRVVVTLATPAAGRKAQREAIYDIERRFYRVEGADLVADGKEHRRAPFDIGLLPEFGIGPFASCA